MFINVKRKITYTNRKPNDEKLTLNTDHIVSVEADKNNNAYVIMLCIDKEVFEGYTIDMEYEEFIGLLQRIERNKK